MSAAAMTILGFLQMSASAPITTLALALPFLAPATPAASPEPALDPGRAPAPAEPLEVVTTIGVLADLAGAIGGERVAVESLTDGRVDAHHVQPRPTLMSRVRTADAFIEIGLQYELWAKRVLDGAGNPRLAVGRPGRIVASAGIATIEAPANADRALGDIHPEGNPHLWLDPLRLRKMAANVAAGLTRLDPAGTEQFAAGLEAWRARLDAALFGEALVEAMGGAKLVRLAERGRLASYLEGRELTDTLGGWLGRARELAGTQVVTYHKTYGYFAARFGLSIPIEIEEHAGISPSGRHRDRVLALMRARDIGIILQASFYDTQAAEWLVARTGAELVRLPLDCGGRTGVADSLELVETTLVALLAAD
ncbi:MAG: metal ABC transporter substrate-binding protein [Planctomycetota bacterium]|jgi:ABC-type Zn uptake system ZnuABC Zn-binding protein ZnuA|nr:metal ABC transporter substrate-binding protein [Planctomycetota bacterium]MDP6988180.1 metal ABC transporter substrate-binding protein [Planctomycetota bacterium]